MADENTPQNEELRRTIADLQAKQGDLGLDFSLQIAELQRRLDEVGQVTQTGSGAAATSGGVAGGAGSIVIGRDVYGAIYHVYQAPPGSEALTQQASNAS